MTEASRAAVDDLIVALTQMAAGLPPRTVEPILFDSRVGVQPLKYLFEQLRGWIRQYPATTASGKIAFILPSTVLLNTIEVLMRIFPRLRVRFFSPREREAALAWLLE
jgi:hypothetical protein